MSDLDKKIDEILLYHWNGVDEKAKQAIKSLLKEEYERGYKDGYNKEKPVDYGRTGGKVDC